MLVGVTRFALFGGTISIVLPDLNPLPYLLTSVEPILKAAKESGKRVKDHITPAAPLTDDSWLHQFDLTNIVFMGQ